jgi:hypothetical protein
MESLGLGVSEFRFANETRANVVPWPPAPKPHTSSQNVARQNA